MKVSGFVYLDGRLVPAKTATISVFDRGLLYADGLLETLRVYGGRPFALERHLERLAASARFLAIPVPKVDWAPAIGELLRRNRMRDAWVRITLTRGPWARGLKPPETPSPTVLITTGTIDPAIASMQSRGVRLTPVPFCRDPFLAAHKTLNYLPGILAKAAATQAEAYDALFTEAKRRVLETTTANLFAWKGEQLWTPKLGVLPGITRALVVETARARGVRVRERAFSVRELTLADEAFVTSSLVEILPVVAVAGVRIGNGRPGPRTRMLRNAFRHLRHSALRKLIR
jgi:branched-subunit amino acid aminotransferase/4-amino-4-deoxychorismate lyase